GAVRGGFSRRVSRGSEGEGRHAAAVPASGCGWSQGAQPVGRRASELRGRADRGGPSVALAAANSAVGSPQGLTASAEPSKFKGCLRLQPNFGYSVMAIPATQ